MSVVSLSVRPWFESYRNTLPADIWEKPIKNCGYQTFSLSKDDVEEFISLNPQMPTFGFGLDKWFEDGNIGSEQFFELLRSKQIFYRRVIEYSASQKQWLTDKFSGKICIFNEMHPIDEAVFDELGITFINFFMPPVRFTKISKIQSVYSNCPEIMRRLRRYEYPGILYKFFALYLHLSSLNKIYRSNKVLQVPQNSCVLIGQCRFDYSKYDFDEKKFVQLGDYEEELTRLTQTYSKIYYTKHPHEVGFYDEELLQRLGIEIVEGIDTYSLMLNKNVQGVCALSSSMLTESRFFGKQEHRLFTNFVDMDKFIGITRHHIRSKSFWKAILGQPKNTESV
jgi:hypothetical protein